MFDGLSFTAAPTEATATGLDVGGDMFSGLSLQGSQAAPASKESSPPTASTAAAAAAADDGWPSHAAAATSR